MPRDFSFFVAPVPPFPYRHGVGIDPHPFTLVSCSSVRSGKHSPDSIIPQSGQVSENDAKPPKSESCRVFHDDVARSNLANDSGHFTPESAMLAVESLTSSDHANVLAREAARDDIHQSTPRFAVEGSDIIPDREVRQASVVLAGEQHAAGVVVEFDGTDGFPSKEFASKYAAACACEKCQLI